jgi:ABC-2 type transport system permease protein
MGPIVLMEKQRQPLKVAVLDTSGTLRAPVEEILTRQRMGGDARFTVVPAPTGDAEEARRVARQAVLDGKLDGYLYLPPQSLESSSAEYYGKNVSNRADLNLMEKAVEEALVSLRLQAAGLDPQQVKNLTRRLDLKTIRLTPQGEREDRGGTFVLAMLLVTMLYTTVAMWGAAIMNGVIEEKSNRLVEVIVSSVPTSALFAGKLIGVGCAGLTQFVVWGLTMAGLSAWGAASSPGAGFPEVSPLLVVAFVVYFLLGYFLYGSLYAAVGSAVNSQQEAQSLAFPVMMPLVVAFVSFPAILRSPDSTMSVVLSLIPFFTPLLMVLRITSVTPPTWQIVLSIVLMLLAIAFTTWVAARIYRVGILMYGKRPTFPEIVRWARMA